MKIVVHGKEFRSRLAVAKFYDINYNRFYNLTIRGYPPEKAIDLIKKLDNGVRATYPVIEGRYSVRGEYFNKLSDIIKYYDIPCLLFYDLYNRGLSLESILKENEQNTDISIKLRKDESCLKVLFISELMAKRCLLRGMTLKDVIRYKGKFNYCFVNGKRFSSVKEVEEFYGLKNGLLLRRIGSNVHIKEALNNILKSKEG